MARILVLYSTIEGHTRRIALAMADRIRDHGHTVCLVDAADVTGHLEADLFDAAIIGGSVHAGSHSDALNRVVAENRDLLDAVPTAFFSVSLTAAHADPEARAEARRPVEALTRATDWTPTVVETVAGALRFSQYGFLKKQLLRWISWRSGGPTDTTTDHDLTDWPRVHRFVDRFLQHVSTIERLRSASWATSRWRHADGSIPAAARDDARHERHPPSTATGARPERAASDPDE
jgi:menaquinone-dependent protoporphyrinogen oxidase